MSNNQSQDRRIYVGLQEGVCAVASSGQGKTWQCGEITPLAHAAARLAVSPADQQRAYLAAYEAGVYRTDDGGQTWRHLDAYPSDYAHSVQADPSDSGKVYVGSEPASIYSSADGGDTWEECAGFLAVPESNQWGFHAPTRDSHVRDLRVAPHDSSYLYAGIEEGGMVRSRDGGATWQQLPGIHDDVHCITLSGARPKSVYVATSRSPYRSDNEGENWEVINTGLDRRYALHIGAAPDDADLVLVTVSANAGRENPQFYRSTDGGRNWQLIQSLGQDGDMVVSFDWDLQSPGTVYAGTEAGQIHISRDHGKTWKQLPVSLPKLAVGALAVAPA